MYESFFGLNESPFNLTPDPRFVYFSKHHQEALSAMRYGVQYRRGFIQVTGSIDVLELVLEIERSFGVAIADEQTGMKVLGSVDTIADFITSERARG